MNNRVRHEVRAIAFALAVFDALHSLAAIRSTEWDFFLLFSLGTLFFTWLAARLS